MSDGANRIPLEQWTVETYAAHNEAMRLADLRFQTERDRRYAEVAVEREKALEIKNEADKAALGLAREIQTYKDEKANELREQINSERGLYATKDDISNAVREMNVTIKPLADYVTSQQGRSTGLSDTGKFVTGAIAAMGTIITIVVLIANHAFG